VYRGLRIASPITPLHLNSIYLLGSRFSDYRYVL
jgi:hypothetical protein